MASSRECAGTSAWLTLARAVGDPGVAGVRVFLLLGIVWTHL